MAETKTGHAGGEAVHVDPHWHRSYWPFWIGFGAFFAYLGIVFPLVALPIFIVFTGGGLAMWIKMDVWAFRHADPSWSHSREDVGWKAGLWGIVLFVGTEVIIFGSIFAIWFVGKYGAHGMGHTGWPPAELGIELPILATFVNTVILVASGGTLHWGMLGLRKGNTRRYLIGLGLTLVLGVIFLLGQVREYLKLIEEGLTIKTHLFGSTFYMLTGTHGLHVFGGLCFLFIVLIRSLAKTQTGKNHLALEAAAIYWHFVDFVWIFLFLVVYLQVI